MTKALGTLLMIGLILLETGCGCRRDIPAPVPEPTSAAVLTLEPTSVAVPTSSPEETAPPVRTAAPADTPAPSEPPWSGGFELPEIPIG